MQIRIFTSSLAAATFITVPALAQGTGIIPVKPIATDAHPSFAVATIKPHNPDERDRGLSVHGDHFEFSSASVSKLLIFAYSISQQQIIGRRRVVAEREIRH